MQAKHKCLFVLLAFVSIFQSLSAYAEDSSIPELKKPISTGISTQPITPEHIRHNRWIAYRLAKNPWLDKLAEADPRIIAAITAHSGPSKILAQHHHLDKIAEADHYLCRRLTRWEGATQKLCRSPYFDKVVALDPQGMYYALERKPEYADVMIRQTMYCELANSDRDMGRYVEKHIKQ